MQSREQLLIELLEEIDVHCAVLVERGVEPVLAMFERASSYVSGRRVIVDNVITGTTGGLTAEGFLRLRCDDGTEQIILAGGVRPALDS
jgi:BirA family transcriptional regulator, biotin operon repressor / biotin---[acetyl-CoA-carboxylase] ligase